MNFDPSMNPAGDMVPDVFELLVLFFGCVCVLAVILGPLRLRDRFAELEQQALKFSHKKPRPDESPDPCKSRVN